MDVEPMTLMQEILDRFTTTANRHKVPDDLITTYQDRFVRNGRQYQDGFVAAALSQAVLRLADEHTQICAGGSCAACEDLRHALAATVVRLRLMQTKELERRAGRGFLRRWLGR
ncbi:hypothetical protein HH310_05715 [Actinoplanes sp. TBRC 11911]|uniref:hypothetical protein n=1 Tax=Actinoplanes sp. TBRC 11911 TaxID=2729386 RepID=UPI00145EBB5B|nr:hypothetical protein [Actinoplanes sp. TBRC 11911]NMO50691.1 hypothetical protein [Actinoplanes sp. TBRC 11911]